MHLTQALRSRPPAGEARRYHSRLDAVMRSTMKNPQRFRTFAAEFTRLADAHGGEEAIMLERHDASPPRPGDIPRPREPECLVA